jgi:hypothetical protein
MDADLQHEPESVPNVAGPVRATRAVSCIATHCWPLQVLAGKAEFTIGSRHVDGGGLGYAGTITPGWA